jgi:hypothetical protein
MGAAPASREDALAMLAEASEFSAIRDLCLQLAKLETDARRAKDIDLLGWVVEMRLRAERKAGQRLLELNGNAGAVQRQVDKIAWIAAARAEFRPSPQSACVVCKKYPSLSEAHHLTPLSWQYERGNRVADHRHAWLCPTHHRALHMLMGAEGEEEQKKGRRAVNVVVDLARDELRALLSLLTMAGAGA